VMAASPSTREAIGRKYSRISFTARRMARERQSRSGTYSAMDGGFTGMVFWGQRRGDPDETLFQPSYQPTTHRALPRV
jgi:hypothetical protein